MYTMYSVYMHVHTLFTRMYMYMHADNLEGGINSGNFRDKKELQNVHRHSIDIHAHVHYVYGIPDIFPADES